MNICGESMSAVIVLGFDVTHAVRTISDYRPEKVVAVIGSVGGEVDPRATIAYNSLSQVATAMGIQVEPLTVEVTDFEKAIGTLEDKIAELSYILPLYVDLGGGLRLLVLETFLAVWRAYRRRAINNAILLIYVEGRARRLEIEVGKLEEIMVPVRREELPEMERKILDVLDIYWMSLAQIQAELQKLGITISKPYLRAILSRLEAKGLVARRPKGLYAKVVR